MSRTGPALFAVLVCAAIAAGTAERGRAQAGQGDVSAGIEVLAPEADLLRSVTSVGTKFDGADMNDQPCTTSTGYVDMPGMTKNFTSSGVSGGDEVVVLFQGEWIGGSGRALLRLVIDGIVIVGPGDDAAPFAPHEGTVVATTGFNFTSPRLLFGPHTAKLQWATTGAQVCVDERSMIILHK